MLIGILEAGDNPPELKAAHGSYAEMFHRLLDGHGFSFRDWRVWAGEMPEAPDEAEGWLITGSRHGVYDDLPWIAPLEDFVRRVMAAKAPLAGICFGHQIMAQALGGQVEKSARGWGVGRQVYRDLREGRDFAVLASHQDQVIAPPEGAEVTAASEFCPVAAMEWRDAPAISWQAHPEFVPAFSRDIIHLRMGVNYPEEQGREGLASLALPLDSAAIGARIAAFFKEARASRAA